MKLNAEPKNVSVSNDHNFISKSPLDHWKIDRAAEKFIFRDNH